jgi:putative endonuclease
MDLPKPGSFSAMAPKLEKTIENPRKPLGVLENTCGQRTESKPLFENRIAENASDLFGCVRSQVQILSHQLLDKTARYRGKRTDFGSGQSVSLDGRRFKSCRTDYSTKQLAIAANGLTSVSPFPLMVAGSNPVAPIVEYHVYVLASGKPGRRYVGSSGYLPNRFTRHNAGDVKSTRHGVAWGLVHSEAFATRAEAVQRQRFLKTGKRRDELDRLPSDVAQPG